MRDSIRDYLEKGIIASLYKPLNYHDSIKPCVFLPHDADI